MKIRHSLVSNSSSSSFIVAYKKGEKCKCCGRGPDDLAEKIRRRDDDGDFRLRAEGIDDIKKYIKDNWFDGEEKENITKQLDQIPNDLTVIYCSVSNHDSDAIEEIEAVEKLGGKIIYREEC